MKSRTLMLSLLLALAVTNHSFGGGLLQKLPKDGVWAQYLLEAEAVRGEARRKMPNGVVTIRSVGSTVIEGEKCRWIELESKADDAKTKAMVVIKVLLREKDLKPGTTSAPRIVRGWKKHPSSKTVKPVTNKDMIGESGLWVFFGAKSSDEKRLKKTKVVDYQKGKLKIAAAKTARLDVQLAEIPPNDLKLNARQTVWTHKSIPFGTAVLRIGWEARTKARSGKLFFTFTLQDFGTGAKSALPENK